MTKGRTPKPKPRSPDVFDRIAEECGSGVTREEVLELWHERAAIREHMGGDSRIMADRNAITDVKAYFTRTASLFG